MLVSNSTVAPVGCGPVCACAPGASGNACVGGAVCGAVCVWALGVSGKLCVDCCANADQEIRE